MVSGVVNNLLQPMVRLIVRGPQGQEETIDALVDTGFNGTLLLPPALVSTLGLPFHSIRTVLLADGAFQDVANHRGWILWENVERPVRVVAAGEQPLLGMTLLVGYRLCVNIVDGGEVTTEPL
jgi:clan AA aspartic protease